MARSYDRDRSLEHLDEPVDAGYPGKCTLTARLWRAPRPGAPMPAAATAPAAAPAVQPVEDPFALHLGGPAIYRDAAAAAPDDAEVAPAVAEALARRGGGAPLPSAVRAEMEAGFGRDLAAVRLHTDGAAAAAADALGARAFTAGADVYFASGAFSAGADGRRLLAHELAHVVQHADGRTGGGRGVEVSHPDDPLEHEAERVAERIAQAPARTDAAGAAPDAAQAAGRGAPAVAGGAVGRLQRFAVTFADPPANEQGDRRIVITGSGPDDVAAGFMRTVTAAGNNVGVLVVEGQVAHLYDRSGARLLPHAIHFLADPHLYPAIYTQGSGRGYGVVLRGADGTVFVSATGGIRGDHPNLELRAAFVEQAAFDHAAAGRTIAIVAPGSSGGGGGGGGGGGAPRRPGGQGGAPRPPGGHGGAPPADAPLRPAALPAGTPHTPAPHPPAAPAARPPAAPAAHPPAAPAATHPGTPADRDQHGATDGTRESGAPGQGGTRAQGAAAPVASGSELRDGRNPTANAPAFPARLTGPDLGTPGSTGTFAIRLDYSIAGADLLSQTLAHMTGISYLWEIYDITVAARAGESAADREARQRLHTVEQARGARTRSRDRDHRVGQLAGTGRALERTDEQIRDDQARSRRDLHAAVAGEGDHSRGERASAVLANLTSIALEDVSANVRTVGALVESIPALLGATEPTEREIPLRRAGVFLVRCLAQPRVTDPSFRRAASVAAKIVQVEAIDQVSSHALGEAERDRDEARDALAAARRDTGHDPDDLRQREERASDTELFVSGSSLDVIRRSLQRKREELARVPDRPENQRRRAHMQEEITQLEHQLGTAGQRETELGGAGSVWRPTAVFVSEETTQSYPLLLQLGRPTLSDGRWHAQISNVTTPDGGTYPGSATEGAGAEAAILAALTALGHGVEIGRGQIRIRMPAPAPADAPFTAGVEHTFDVRPSNWALARRRFDDLVQALMVAGLIASGGAATVIGVAGGALGGAMAAARLITRWREHTIHLDGPAAMDVIGVLGAVLPGVAAIGRLRVVREAGRFALVAAEANRAVRIVELLNETVNWGGFLYGELSALDQVMAINELEASGAISHAEALRQRASVIGGAIRDGVIQVHGAMREEHANAEHAPPPAAEHAPPPAAEHAPPPAAEHAPPPAAEHTPPPAAEHAPPPAGHVAPPTAEHAPPPAAEHTPPPAHQPTEETAPADADRARRSRRRPQRPPQEPVAEPPRPPSNIDAALAALAAPGASELDRNTAESIRTGAVELVPLDQLHPVSDGLYTYAPPGQPMETVHWQPGTVAMASPFGHRIFIDGSHGADALRGELRHEVNHALHPHDPSGYHAAPQPQHGVQPLPADQGAALARFADEFRAHYVEGRVGQDPAEIRRTIIDNYPEMRALYNANGEFRARVDAMERPAGNYLNSPRLAPIYTAMDVFDSHEARVDAAQLRTWIEGLNASDRELLRGDRRFDRFVTEHLDLPPAEIERIMNLLDREPSGNGSANPPPAAPPPPPGDAPPPPPQGVAPGEGATVEPAGPNPPIGTARRSAVGGASARIPRRVPAAELRERSGPTNMGWAFELYVEIDGREYGWGHASVDADGVVHNPDIASDHTIGDTPVRLVGDAYSITDMMNQRLEAAYQRHAGEPISGYSAGFQQTNQTAFNRAHELALARGLVDAQANAVAAAATPSGYVTVMRGFGDLDVQILSGGPGTYRVNATMRRGEFPAELRPHLEAIRAQMRSERPAR